MSLRRFFFDIAVLFAVVCCPSVSSAWYDETHLAVAKAAGHRKWFNAAGADMLKLKAEAVEKANHYINNPRGTHVTPAMVMAQASQYDRAGDMGHLYGAVIASLRAYMRTKALGKYGEYHLAFCAHYIGDLSQPLHNTRYSTFNRKHHQTIESGINKSILADFEKIKCYPVSIRSEKDLAREIARIANISLSLGYEMEAENRLLSREEILVQLGHSASLLKAVLEYAARY